MGNVQMDERTDTSNGKIEYSGGFAELYNYGQWLGILQGDLETEG